MIEPLRVPLFDLKEAAQKYQDAGLDYFALSVDFLTKIDQFETKIQSHPRIKKAYEKKINLIIGNLPIIKEAIDNMRSPYLSELYYTNPRQLARIILFNPNAISIQISPFDTPEQVDNKLYQAMKEETKKNPTTPIPAFTVFIESITNILRQITPSPF